MTIAYWALLAAIFLPYLFTGFAKFQGGFGPRQNHNPRHQNWHAVTFLPLPYCKHTDWVHAAVASGHGVRRCRAAQVSRHS